MKTLTDLECAVDGCPKTIKVGTNHYPFRPKNGSRTCSACFWSYEQNGTYVRKIARHGEPMALVELAIKEDVSKGADDPCRDWPYGKDTNGYGQIIFKGNLRHVTRVAMEKVGRPLGELHVLHSCDRKQCFMLGHLRPGTNMDNVLDKMAKGRQTKGENGYSKLKEKDVIEILSLKGQIRTTELSSRYGVSCNTIRCILRGVDWAHIPRPEIKKVPTEAGTS
jgi:hypothetical protein